VHSGVGSISIGDAIEVLAFNYGERFLISAG
jgi:hypothetical protein